MPRTTDALVRGIYDVEAAANLGPFIEIATGIVTKQVEPNNTDTAELVIVETWLSAHMYSVINQPSKKDKADVVDVQYQGEYGMHLNSTRWGMAAMAADSSGSLSNWNSEMISNDLAPKNVEIFFVGTVPD